VENQKTVAFAMSSVAALSKFAMDVCLYMSQNFDFITYRRILQQVPASCRTKKIPCI
jgi:argininosuccinate lyase